MPNPGRPFTYAVLVPAAPAVAMQSLLSVPAAGNYFDGYEVRQVTWNSVHITRRYVPVWAIVIAVVGMFFFIGLVALLARDTEVLTITVHEQEDGSYLDFSGMAAPGVSATVNHAIDSLLIGVAMPPPPPMPPMRPAVPFPPPGAPVFPAPATRAPEPVNNKTCPECAETIRAAARSCRFCGYSFNVESP
jgi:hypothetical protein